MRSSFGPRGHRLAVVILSLAGAGCGPPQEPPGRRFDAPRVAPPTLDLDGATTATATASTTSTTRDEPGHGAKVASIAMRTWVYAGPSDRAQKLGYLRAGAVVDRAEDSAGTDGCAGGWYRVNPRGYVCVGKGASLALTHQVVEAAFRGPQRRAPLPYTYVISRSPPPHLYFRLPTRADQERVEGPTLGAHLAHGSVVEFASTPLDDVPTYLAEGRDLPKPYGAEEKLHYSVHTGRAKEASAFGLITSFQWTADASALRRSST